VCSTKKNGLLPRRVASKCPLAKEKSKKNSCTSKMDCSADVLYRSATAKENEKGIAKASQIPTVYI
jgi:hypothetical protein